MPLVKTELVALADKNVWNARAGSLRWALPVTYMSHCVWSSWQQGLQVRANSLLAASRLTALPGSAMASMA